MFKRFTDWLALTATERRVLLFVTGAFVAGLGIRLFQETFPATPDISYETADSTFAALSAAALTGPEHKPQEQAGPLDLNTATKQQLVALPGIGDVTAERIILYREDHGPFKSVDDLRKVKGISKNRFEQLKSLVIVY